MACTRRRRRVHDHGPGVLAEKRLDRHGEFPGHVEKLRHEPARAGKSQLQKRPRRVRDAIATPLKVLKELLAAFNHREALARGLQALLDLGQRRLRGLFPLGERLAPQARRRAPRASPCFLIERLAARRTRQPARQAAASRVESLLPCCPAAPAPRRRSRTTCY